MCSNCDVRAVLHSYDVFFNEEPTYHPIDLFTGVVAGDALASKKTKNMRTVMVGGVVG